MLMIRLIFVLLVITAMVLLGLYLLSSDKKYLHYFKQTIKYTFFFGDCHHCAICTTSYSLCLV